MAKRKKALLLVDIQNGFVKRSKNTFIKNLSDLLFKERYSLYVDVIFHAEKGSLWDRQTHWMFPYEETILEVKKLLTGKHLVRVVKETRSAFKGKPKLAPILKKYGIQEVHIVGFDTNDCVFATAQEAFDLGFYTYVIEECTGSSSGKKMHANAIAILRDLGLTNYS